MKTETTMPVLQRKPAKGTKQTDSATTNSSAAVEVYEHLRRKILQGELAGGTLLVEQDVARTLNVSRTPVHEALRRLGAEGLLDVEPRRRTRVATIDATDIDQIYDIRLLLEEIASVHAATAIENHDLDTLRREAATMEELISVWSQERMRDFVDSNVRFHRTILEGARNRWLANALGPILDLALGPINSLASSPERPVTNISDDELQRTCRQHREIVDALAAGSPEWAASATRSHVLAARHDWARSPIKPDGGRA